MNINLIQNATNKKLKCQELWLAQENNHNIIDVSLCAGQTIIVGQDDAQFSQFAEALYIFMQQLSSLFPFITPTEKNLLHSTLLTIFNDTEIVFDKYKYELFSLCKKITQEFNKYTPLTINFQDIALTSNGSIIILGESQKLSEFRSSVYNQYNTPEDLRKNIIHITLGRLLQDAPFENMNNVNRFLQTRGHLALPSIIINHPKIVFSRDLHCSNVDINLAMEFNSSI